MRRASPDELATFSLAILHVNVAAGIFQAAILEFAIHVNAIVKYHVLILEDFVLMSIHRFTRAHAGSRSSMSRRAANTVRGAETAIHRMERLDEATIHITWMQASESAESRSSIQESDPAANRLRQSAGSRGFGLTPMQQRIDARL